MAGETTAHLAKTLRDLLGSDVVLTGGATAPYRLADREPSIVVLARGDDDVARVLALATAEGLGVVPWGGGVHQSIGRPPARFDVAVDLRRMNRIVTYESGDMTITVQAGISCADLDQRLGGARQFWPADPPLADQATVGGVIAGNLNGPLRCRYGTVRDMVLGVRVAHADGTITKAGARVVKNATAYDLTKLYVGSYGTLGILLEATLRLQPRPSAEQGWVLAGASLVQCHHAAMNILRSSLAPNRLELLDTAGSEHCGIHRGGPALAVSFSGVPEAMQDQAAKITQLAREAGLTATELQRPVEQWAALRDFPWRASAPSDGRLCALWRGAVPASECGKALEAVHGAVARWGDGAIAATVSHGVLRGVLSAAAPADLAKGIAAAREALQVLQGYLVVQDAPASLGAALDPWGPMPPEASIMRQIRAAFDAKGILNPGRFIDGA